MSNNFKDDLVGIKNLIKELKTIPNDPGVYTMLDQNSKILYIGKAKNLKKRVFSYSQFDKLPIRLQRMVMQIASVKIIVTKSEVEALLLECNLIKKEKPPFNVLLKDDKSFPYIALSMNHSFPKLFKFRGEKSKENEYFGPFPSSEAVDESIIMIQKVFQLRTCNDYAFSKRDRPCLQYYIKQCSAPCVNRITTETYNNCVSAAKDFLNGKSFEVQKMLSAQMEECSKNLMFEEAAFYRDRLKMLSKIQEKQRINVEGLNNADVVAIEQISSKVCCNVFFFRNGKNLGSESFFLINTEGSSIEEMMHAFLIQFYKNHEPPNMILLSHEPIEIELLGKAISEFHDKKVDLKVPKTGLKKEIIEHASINAKNSLNRTLKESHILKELEKELGLLDPIKRIECYDNSHISGKNAFGVMIVATVNGFEKSSYKKFALDQSFQGDDISMMKSVLSRRVSHKEWPMPDLFLIDGGKTQLNAAHEILKDTKVPILAIAKGEERNAGKETFFMIGKDPFKLPHHSSLLYFLQRVRDEAHRFAIGTHRAGRQKKMISSKLDSIPGIGGLRKKNLLHHFGSVSQIESADLKDLCSVKGISESLAKTIYSYFHGPNKGKSD